MSRRIVVFVVVGVLAVASVIMVRGLGSDRRVLTAEFASTTSLYEGAQVKVLGVEVGSVESITVAGTKVEVEISYDESVNLPADVHALIVPPSIVGDRFVQLAPAYESGSVLADDARLDLSRTGVPLELDETYKNLDKLAAGLGPEGANKDGALSRLVTSTARNLDGRGQQFNTTVRDLAAAVNTLAGSSDDITGTVTNVGTLADTLADEDPEMRALVTNLARVSTQLNGQRDDITLAVESLREALDLVADFTKDNRSEVRSTVDGLTDVSDGLTRRTDELEQLVDIAPVGLTSLMNIYIPTNWDVSKPGQTPVEARTGNNALRGAILPNLDVILGSALGSVCVQLPPAQQQQLSAFCSALSAAGGSLGKVLGDALTNPGGRPAPVNPEAGATSLGDLVGGVG